MTVTEHCDECRACGLTLAYAHKPFEFKKWAEVWRRISFIDWKYNERSLFTDCVEAGLVEGAD